MTKFKQAVIAAALFSITGAASAVQISGEIHIDGSGVLDSAPSGTSPGATTLTMNAAGVVNIDPALTTGDFDTFLDPLDPVTFSTTTISFEPTFNGSLSSFWSAAGFSFELTQLAESVEINGFINLSGLGIITGNGFDATNGRINVTGVGSDENVSITAETIPEPLTLGLLGIGLLGIGFSTRRSRKSA